MEVIIFCFMFIIVLSVGEYALEKYKEDTEIHSVKLWKRILIVFGYGAFSVLIIPIAIAKWAVNSTISFKEEEEK